MSQHEEWLEQFDALCQDPAIRNRSFYPDFRRGWEALLRKASHSAEQYFDPDAESVFPVPCHFDRSGGIFPARRRPRAMGAKPPCPTFPRPHASQATIQHC